MKISHFNSFQTCFRADFESIEKKIDASYFRDLNEITHFRHSSNHLKIIVKGGKITIQYKYCTNLIDLMLKNVSEKKYEKKLVKRSKKVTCRTGLRIHNIPVMKMIKSFCAVN